MYYCNIHRKTVLTTLKRWDNIQIYYLMSDLPYPIPDNNDKAEVVRTYSSGEKTAIRWPMSNVALACILKNIFANIEKVRRCTLLDIRYGLGFWRERFSINKELIKIGASFFLSGVIMDGLRFLLGCRRWIFGVGFLSYFFFVFFYY